MKRLAYWMVPALLCAACDGSPPYDDEAPLTVDTLVPGSAEVHQERAVSFDFQGREVRLTMVQYGNLMDCTSGCFSSVLCAIEDREEALLFYADWDPNAPAPEEPLDLNPSCECGDINLGWCTTMGMCEPPGKVHPFVLTAEFLEFAEQQMGSGTFRSCVSSYLAYGCLQSSCI